MPQLRPCRLSLGSLDRCRLGCQVTSRRIIVGVLGRAQRLYPLEILGYVFLANHYHLLLRVEDAERLAKFMGYFNGNLAREVARLTGWDDKVWARRYQAILVTDEEAAQVDRLQYILENSCKEGLADSPIHWPGVHCAKALIVGDRVEGTWFDRKLEYQPGASRFAGRWPGWVSAVSLGVRRG